LITTLRGSTKMATITLSFPKDLKERLDKHPEVNWPEVMRRSIKENIRKLEKFKELDRKRRL